MVLMSNRKGESREREFVNRTVDHGFSVMRAPASGGATTRDLPDVFIGRDGDCYALECKSSSDLPIYIDGEEIEDLEYFAADFGATALIATRFDYDTDWGILDPKECHETAGGRLRVKREKSEGAPSLDEVFA